jgi:hypothetical protein
LVRPFEDILKSWIRYYKVPNYRVSKLCDEQMAEHGAMGQGILALETLLEHHKDNLKIISYDSLCSKPKETITELYDFLNIPYYKHKFKNFSQVDTSGVKPSIIRTNKVEKINYKDDIIIPESVKEKYKKQIVLLNECSR